MDPFSVVIVVFGALVALVEAFRPGTDDPNWELRQRGLDPEYRNWLAAMATSIWSRPHFSSSAWHSTPPG